MEKERVRGCVHILAAPAISSRQGVSATWVKRRCFCRRECTQMDFHDCQRETIADGDPVIFFNISEYFIFLKQIYYVESINDIDIEQ